MPARCASTAATSAARLFMQLSTRRVANTTTPILDVFLPPTRGFHLACTTARDIRSKSIRDGIHHAHKNTATAALRPFSSTSTRRKTVAIYNPQKDDEGNEMTLEITPRAANRLSQIMEKDGNPHLALRISVEAGGCHGFQYLMSLTTLPSSIAASRSTTPGPGNPSSPPETAMPNPPSEVAEAEMASSSLATASSSEDPSKSGIGEDDTVLAFVKDDTAEQTEDVGRALAMGPKIVLDESSLNLLKGPKIVLDESSLNLLKGSKVDFTMELIGSQFKIVDNPYATSSCGCGTSFDIKDL